MGIQNPVGGLVGGNMGIATGIASNTTISNNIINGFWKWDLGRERQHDYK